MATLKNEVFLGLDVGTQSTKAVLYHPSSQTIKARASSSYDLDPNPEHVNGRAEQHPHKWIYALHDCFRSLAPIIQKEQFTLTGIGVSGQQHGMVPLDSNLDVIRSAKLWCDVEASSQAEEFSEKATKIMRENEMIQESDSWTIPAGFTAPKVLWMKENEAEKFSRVKYIMLPHDYINLCLSSGLGHDLDVQQYNSFESLLDYKADNSHIDIANITHTTDAGDASGTGLLHPSEPRYVEELTKLISEDYISKLPHILPPEKSAGNLSDHWKRILGIGDKMDSDIDIKISAGSGDNMSSAMGCACTEPGRAVLSLGTSGTIFGVSDAPIRTGTPVAPFRDATGCYLPLVCVMSCTGILNSVLENWCVDDGNMTHAEATTKAEEVPPGCHGISFLPYLGGERTPDWPHASGALLGLNPQNMAFMGKEKTGVMYRAAMEGITYLMADAMDQIRDSCGEGFKPTSLYVVGGGSKNKLWRQMLADVLGLELLFPLEPESAALGAAFQVGAVVRGMPVAEFIRGQKVELEEVVVKPSEDQKTQQLYKDGMDRYRSYSRKLFEK